MVRPRVPEKTLFIFDVLWWCCVVHRLRVRLRVLLVVCVHRRWRRFLCTHALLDRKSVV